MYDIRINHEFPILLDGSSLQLKVYQNGQIVGL